MGGLGADWYIQQAPKSYDHPSVLACAPFSALASCVPLVGSVHSLPICRVPLVGGVRIVQRSNTTEQHGPIEAATKAQRADHTGLL